MKRLGLLYVLVILILSGCSVRKDTLYEPGQYKVSDFKTQDYNLKLLDNDVASSKCGVYILPIGVKDFVQVGEYKPDTTINLPLSNGEIQNFEVSGCQFTMEKS